MTDQVALNAPRNQLWVLSVSHKHGQDYYVCESEKAMWQALHDYVKEWWDQEVARELGEIPTDPQEATDAYFECMQERGWPESYDWSLAPIIKEKLNV